MIAVTAALAFFSAAFVGFVAGGWMVKEEYERAERLRIAKIKAEQKYIRDLKEERRRLIEENQLGTAL